ncbi:CGNR zinc finger domain-containing protein [Actinocorallia populi]|uniref:CGNR zinc finger domain-containing protein n=1 Tax=Actinocorallia populi TaxID=2079200 RepID=UPI0018E59148|nr:CGNR zinc finger domain-containing protein [Actinocorallia populi]
MDPRPLTGEPISVELLNTRWIQDGRWQDLLTSPDGLAIWLASPTVVSELGEHPVHADEPTLAALLRARDGLAALLADPADTAAADAVLARGVLRLAASPQGVVERLELDDLAYYPAWTAVRSHLRLIGDRPDRFRKCANEACVLHFFDISKNGTRRWCSMTGCGNRAKASRHYARTRSGRD